MKVARLQTNQPTHHKTPNKSTCLSQNTKLINLLIAKQQTNQPTITFAVSAAETVTVDLA